MSVHNLPHAAAPFVNRVSEIDEITRQLNNASCRLLTLAGPGGIGKTRLAMRVATNCAHQFDDGVYFVPLQSIDSPDFIVWAIADVVSFAFSPSGNPRQQLLQYLREKALMLVLDNFEHLLDGAELLTAILAAAPEIKLLVTSREVLNLQEEWRYLVRGLQYPETATTEQPGAYSAVQLFVERARQVRADLALADDQAAVIRVCQLVEGMPLALELAAVWAKTLPPNEIAIEIQRNLDFLSTSLRNIPQRHQSIIAVFEQTWQRLSDDEQRVFKALSVFSGGFRREASEAVAGVSMRVLSDLVDKSLLTREPDGRYQIHELLRQYAQMHLETAPEEVIRIHDLHTAYYAHFLHERTADLSSHRQRKAALEIEADIDNVRVAWSWVVEHSRVEHFDQLECALFRFYSIRSRYHEGMDAFSKAVQMLDNDDAQTGITLAKALCDLGSMSIRMGAIEKARAALERSWLIYSGHGVLPELGRGLDPRLPLGLIYLSLGSNINLAEQLGHDALRDHTQREDYFNLAITYILLAMTTRVQGKYEEAREYAQKGHACTLTTGDAYFRSYCLREWAAVSQLMGDTDDAKRRIRASYDIQKDFGDTKGMGDSLNNLGRIALREGDNAEARRCFEQARTIFHDLGDKVGLATSLEGMGNSARVMGHAGEARRYLHEALQISSQHTASYTPSILVGIGELFLQTGQQVRGIELLALALHHPAGDHDAKERARRLLNRHQSPEVAQSAPANLDFNAVITALLDELLIPDTTTQPSQTQQAGGALIEPLSEREWVVLTLIAEGFSNREIAEQLFLSVATVKWYITHIYSKLGVQSRNLAIVRARQLNILP